MTCTTKIKQNNVYKQDMSWFLQNVTFHNGCNNLQMGGTVLNEKKKSECTFMN